MPSLTATTPSTASADSTVELPRIGVLGVMQRLYDAMLPGIGERQAEYARELGAALDGIASVTVTQPVKDREDIERAMRELDGAGLDGLLVVMLTYGPAMNIARALADTRLPVCIANTQPVPEVTGHGTWPT